MLHKIFGLMGEGCPRVGGRGCYVAMQRKTQSYRCQDMQLPSLSSAIEGARTVCGSPFDNIDVTSSSEDGQDATAAAAATRQLTRVPRLPREDHVSATWSIVFNLRLESRVCDLALVSIQRGSRD